MPYITREDGEHFVIPSYRDVLTAKSKNVLKKEILQLSHQYGDYITLQRKAPMLYEVAFSPDTGYLLGESIWHYFKRPLDLIYCEAIPNTTEAIMVIVKEGSVYLDGSFPLDSLPEELIIFLTQKNNFDIYIHGDIPISKTPEEGKFSFDTASVKTFTVLEKPVFPTLPLLRSYQFQLVDPVLKAHGIGVFPAKQIAVVVVFLGLAWMLWSYLTAEGEEVEVPVTTVEQVNPYQGFIDAFMSPAPDEIIQRVTGTLDNLLTIPGWQVLKLSYSNGVVIADMQSRGSKVESLMLWAHDNHADVNIKPSGIALVFKLTMTNRKTPKKIYPLKDVMAVFIDKLSNVYPGNHLRVNETSSKGVFSTTNLTVELSDVSLVVLSLIGEQLKDLPFVVQDLSLNVASDSLTGTINLQILGS